MKRIVTVCIVALTAIGAVSAQGFGGGQGMMGQGVQAQVQPAQTKTTIEGKLAVVQGHPAVVVKEKTYFVAMPQYLYGFVDGLKEGAAVKLEGYETSVPYAPNSFFFRVATLTIGSKSYDLSQAVGAMGGGMGGGMGMRGGRADGQGGRGRGRF